MTKSRNAGRINYGTGTCSCCQKRVKLTVDGKIGSHSKARGRQCIGLGTKPVDGSVSTPKTTMYYSY